MPPRMKFSQAFFNFIRNDGFKILILLCSSTLIKATPTRVEILNASNNKNDMASSFTDTMIVRLGSVPDLPKDDEKDIISISIRKFLEDDEALNNHHVHKKFKNINVEQVRENLEMHRDSMENDLLLTLTLSGDYYSTSNKQDKNEAFDTIKKRFENDNKMIIDILHELSDGSIYFSLINKFKFVTNTSFSSIDKSIVDVSSVSGEGHDNISSFDIDVPSSINKSFVVSCGFFSMGMGVLFAIIMHLRDNRSKKSIVRITDKKLFTIDENSESTHDMSEISEHRSGRMRKSTIPAKVEVAFQKFDNNDPMMLTPSPSSSRKRSHSGESEQLRGEFNAPAGKLGITLDAVQGCPVVHKINPGSPLHGALLKNDWIVGVDEIDTTHMPTGEVTKLMVSRMKSARTITYVRRSNLCAGDDRNT